MAKTTKLKRVFGNAKGVYGVTYIEDGKPKKIVINKKLIKKDKESIISTILHEELHAKHPRMHEKTVRKLEKKALKNTSAKKKKALYAKYK